MKPRVVLHVLLSAAVAMTASDAFAKGKGKGKGRGKGGWGGRHHHRRAWYDPPEFKFHHPVPTTTLAQRAHARMEVLGAPKDYSEQLRQDLYRALDELDRDGLIVKREERFIAMIRAEMLASGDDIDEEDEAGRTLLHEAAAMGYADAVAFLLEQGAKPDVRDRSGLTPRDLAAALGDEEIVRLLTRSAPTR
jgi:hypothetical protein